MKKAIAILFSLSMLVFTGCSGGGGDGMDGKTFLTSTSDEDPGDNCPNGGVRVDMGYDENGNGILETDEIQDTTYICHGQDGDDGENGGSWGQDGVWYGDYVIMDQTDLDELENYHAVYGSLIVDPFIPVETIQLQTVEFVVDTIYITNSEITSFSAPVLKTVGSVSVWGNNYDLEEISFPLLEKVLRHFSISGEATCISLSLPELKYVGSGFSLQGDISAISLPKLEVAKGSLSISSGDCLCGNLNVTLPALYTAGGISMSFSCIESFTAPELVSASGVSFSYNIELTNFSLPKLTNLTFGFSANSNPVLQTIDLPLLKSTETGLMISSNESLESVSFPLFETTGGDLWISSNESLESFYFPLLETIAGDLRLSYNALLSSFNLLGLARVEEDFTITNNTELPTAAAEELRDQVLDRDGIGGTINISNNKP